MELGVLGATDPPELLLLPWATWSRPGQSAAVAVPGVACLQVRQGGHPVLLNSRPVDPGVIPSPVAVVVRRGLAGVLPGLRAVLAPVYSPNSNVRPGPTSARSANGST